MSIKLKKQAGINVTTPTGTHVQLFIDTDGFPKLKNSSGTIIDLVSGVSGPAGGDLSGTYPNPSVLSTAALKTLSLPVSVSSSAAPTTGQVLTAINSTAATWQTPSGGAPSGSAGGDLGGTYPNPTVSTTAALKSASTNVNTSSATAPSSGQVLTATSNTAATWQTPASSLPPNGSAGGDLSGTYPNPTVSTTAALKSASTNVNTSSATAPTTGQVLTATDSTHATWQTPSGSPTGSAGGDLSGTYPNPTVSTTAALKSASTNVNTSSATAPTTGQVLTATDSTHATWQTPSGSPTGSAGGDLSGTYPNPTVSTTAALKSASTNVNTSSATAPTTGQVLTATDSTHATWQTPAGTVTGGSQPLWTPPTSPHANNVEFDSTTAPTGWEWWDDTDNVVMTVSGVPDGYTGFTTTHIVKEAYHTNWRTSYAAWQLTNESSGNGHFCTFAKNVTVPTNCYIWARLGWFMRVNTQQAQSNDLNLGIGFFALDGSNHANLQQNSVILYSSMSSSSSWNYAVSGWNAGAFSSSFASSNLFGGFGPPWDYLLIQKIGTTYHNYLIRETGTRYYMGSVTNAATMGSVGFYFRTSQSVTPANAIHVCDFFRQVDTIGFPT